MPVPQVQPASAKLRLDIDGIVRKELARLGTAKRQFTLEGTRHGGISLRATTRLKGPLVLTGFTGWKKGAGMDAGFRLSGQWK